MRGLYIFSLILRKRHWFYNSDIFISQLIIYISTYYNILGFNLSTKQMIKKVKSLVAIQKEEKIRIRNILS